MNKLSFTIRPAEAKDAPAIFGFLCELEECEFDYQVFDWQYRTNLHANHTLYLVAADKDDIPIGYISCHGQLLLHHGGMVYEIQEMFVEKAFRSQGIGQSLLQALEEDLVKRDYHSLEVTTNKKRTQTLEFYAKNGFEPTHVKFTKTR